MIASLLLVFALTGMPPADSAGVRLLVRTDYGAFEMVVDTARAPLTASNFLASVDAGLYEGGAFFRTVRPDNQPADAVRIDVIQALADTLRDEGAPIRLETTRETGLRHLDGTVSMARAAPHTATTSFFICIGEQPELDHAGRRNPDGQGFAAFGRVVRGMAVVRRIHAAPADGQRLTPPVVIRSITRL